MTSNLTTSNLSTSAVAGMRATTDIEHYMTTAEVAEVLRAPVETVRYWRHVGKGPESFKAGRRVLYAESRVIAWIEDQQAGGSVA